MVEISGQAGSAPRGAGRAENLAERIYQKLKNDIFDFRLLPGDRFTETEVADRMGVSRTPVREALFRLQRENYVDVLYRNGWRVRPFNFEYFEDLYDVRTVLECAAVKRICDQDVVAPQLQELKRVWLVPEDERTTDIGTLSALDERFHELLVEAAGNGEMARMHHSVSERIRIIRRLDFTQGKPGKGGIAPRTTLRHGGRRRGKKKPVSGKARDRQKIARPPQGGRQARAQHQGSRLQERRWQNRPVEERGA